LESKHGPEDERDKLQEEKEGDQASRRIVITLEPMAIRTWSAKAHFASGNTIVQKVSIKNTQHTGSVTSLERHKTWSHAL